MLVRAGILVVVSALLATGFAGEVKMEEQAKVIPIQMGIYFAPEPTTDPFAKLEELGKAHGVTIVTAGEKLKDEKRPALLVSSKWVPLADYAPPDEKAWQYRTTGIPAESRAQVEAAKQVLVLNFSADKAQILLANRKMSIFLVELSTATGGLPWDEETRKLYSVAAWREKRVTGWKDDLPDIRSHIVIDAYRDGEFIRAVTLGMRKFGQPDLVAEGVTANTTRNMGHTINAVAQALVEQSVVQNGRLRLDFSNIKHPEVKTDLMAKPGPGATGKITMILKKVEPQAGDADNQLLQMDFAVPGQLSQERQQAGLKSLFGATDSLTKVKSDDAALKAASVEARKKLLALRPRVEKGFEPNEHLSVKGPFKSEDGKTEWMWVEVTSWKDGVLTGTLINEPYWVKSLKPGSRVTVKESEVFDYIWAKPDGSSEGNETGKLLDRAKE